MDRSGATGHSEPENGVEGRLSVQIALFRLIRFILKRWRCAQKPYRSSTMSARLDQPEPFQMKQIVPQSTVCDR
jgi:hypothetical protein